LILYVFIKVFRKKSDRLLGEIIKELDETFMERRDIRCLTPSAVSSGCLGPFRWLGVPDAVEGLKTWTVFESRKLVLEVCDSNSFDVWDISSEDIF